MISSSASAASSSSSREEVMPSTPSSERRMASHPAGGPGAAPPITPQNPFDQITAAPSAVSAADFLISAELTPPRSPATSISPNPSGSSVSAPTTPVTLKGAPSMPQSAPPMMHANVTMLSSGVSSGPPRSTQRLPPSGPTVLQAVPSSTTMSTGVSQPVFDDDENTEPSSANNSQQAQQPYPQGVDPAVVAGSFARFLETTRRRLSSGAGALGAARGGGGRGPADSEEDDAMLDATDAVLIAGYLQKLGRNGKWQTRWFETDGECLSYYKSSKRNKLLATLDLAKVGQVETDESDSRGCSFTIQVLGRLYHLRANSRASCKDWVITLNRVKEARLNQGNTKLVHDLLEPDTEAVAPRVVVVANRQRTRAVDESQAWENMINSEENPAVETSYDPSDPKRLSALGNVVLARWTKRRSSLSRLGAKLARWARSLKKYRCSEVETESVQLDRHVHPPGHDDKTKKQRAAAQPPNLAQPSRVARACSSASEDDARFIA